MEYFRQCSLQNKNISTVAWITEELAKSGKWVKFLDDDSEWCVTNVGNCRVSKIEATDKSRSHLRGFESIRK